MSFDIEKNWFLTISAIVIALGITIGTGSLYRFIYNYNLIMTFTMFIMAIVVFYQYFVPISPNIKSGTTMINKNLSMPGIILISFMIVVPLVSDILNNVPSLEIVYFYIAMLSLSILLNRKFRQKILNAYLIIIVVLSIISMLMILLSTFTDYLAYFPQIRTSFHFNTDFYFISSISGNPLWIRNQSIFWEPGAFGFHLIFATLLAYKRKNTILIVILILTCISTFSTTVFFFLILLCIYHLFFGENRLKLFITIMSISILFFIVVNLIIENKLILELMSQALYKKFIPSSRNYISYVSRTRFTMEALKLFLDNFFIGVGHYGTTVELEVIKSRAAVTTSGLAGLLAELGLFGVFCIFLYTRYFWKFGLIAIPITMIWLNGEFLQYSPLAIFILADSADYFANRIFPQKVNIIDNTE